MAAHRAVTGVFERDGSGPAQPLHPVAAVGEGAAVGQLVDHRRQAGNGLEPPFAAAQFRHAVDEPCRIGVHRRVEHGAGRAGFDNLARVHHRDTVAKLADDAEIGYMPVRVWGCPTTAMWVYRLGPERAKRMLFTGDRIKGSEAESMGLVLKSVPATELDGEVERLAERMAGVPVNQLMMQKLVVNQAIEAMGLKQTQMFATIFDGITRHSPEGLNFKHRAEEMGWKHAVRERDLGTFDWTQNRPINAPKT